MSAVNNLRAPATALIAKVQHQILKFVQQSEKEHNLTPDEVQDLETRIYVMLHNVVYEKIGPRG